MSPPITERLWHGGVPGLRPGDLITPGHRRLGITGCPICAGRDAGNTDQIDPPSRHPDKIYLTTSREYARFYAALSRGDLYRVSPVGPVQRSAEDTIATYMASSARVVAVYARAVTLTWSQRRALHREWKAADEAAVQERGSAS